MGIVRRRWKSLPLVAVRGRIIIISDKTAQDGATRRNTAQQVSPLVVDTTALRLRYNF
jgi:hypothetical protein